HSTPLLRNVLTARAGYIAGRAGETTRRSAKTPLLMLTGAGAGAALMYIFDPQQGRRRRAIARDKLAHSSRVAGERAQATWKDVRQRSYGLYAEGRRLFRKGQVSDDTLQ